MTQTMPDRETITQPIAHRRYITATYDIRPAAMRPDETLIFPIPDRFSEQPMVEMGHLQKPQTLDDILDDATVPVPPAAYYPEAGEVDKPLLRRGVRRAERDPRWTWALVGAGMTVVLSMAAIGASALLGVAW